MAAAIFMDRRAMGLTRDIHVPADPIAVGIIGASPDWGWAKDATIPALAVLPDFRLHAISTSRRESADRAAAQFGVPLAFDDSAALIAEPSVDLVVVNVKVPFHRDLVCAALRAGKHVYCEWPLGRDLAEALEMAALAREVGRRSAVGLQGRATPAINFVRELVADGYVGEVLSTSVIGAGMGSGPVVGASTAYTADASNGATMIAIGMGHTVDALCYCLGEFDSLNAVTTIRRATLRIAETGEERARTDPDQVMVQGLLASGAAASIHFRGGRNRATNLLWEINGTAGDLRISTLGGGVQAVATKIEGARGDDLAMAPLVVPERFYRVSRRALAGYAHNVAEAYHRFAQDIRTGTTSCASFDDAVVRHRMIDAIERAAKSGERQISSI
jgi:predicted dehydrogenase